jgi:ribonuclease BN (tRNA processing enzyme)
MNRTDLLGVSHLERINQIVDLSIDRGLFWLIEAQDGLFVYSEKARKCLDAIQESDPIEKLALDIYVDDFPVEGLLFTPEVAELLGVECSTPLLVSFKEAQDPELLKHWASLYWGKKIRGEILKNNTTKWSLFLDELLRYVEKNLPAPKGHQMEWDTTVFNFLMELSALELGQGSYGFAERARRWRAQYLDKSIPPDRKERYNRWIWYNMGLAFQHDGQHKKAALEYNRVIRQFWEHISADRISCGDPEAALEFLLNIATALHQRAQVNLQLQLGYHSLETLEKDLIGKEWLQVLSSSGNRVLRESAVRHGIRGSLLRLRSLLQLEELAEAENEANAHLVPALFDGTAFEWNENTSFFPKKSVVAQVLGTQLVEETAAWFMEKARRVQKDLTRLLESDGRKSNDQELTRQLNLLSKRLAAINEGYWDWVRYNDKDERVYFSLWGQFLKVGAEILSGIESHFVTVEKEARSFLVSLLKLYIDKRDRIPSRQCENTSERLRLETFTSDDIPDMVGGLMDFFEEMARFLATGGSPLIRHEICSFFDEGEYGNPEKMFKQDHFGFLAALDVYDKEFGDNRKIGFLTRCNSRLIWTQNKISAKGCESCLKTNWLDRFIGDELVSRESFAGLLPCAGEPDKMTMDAKGEALLCYNYQQIMERAEHHLTRHLKEKSRHSPRSDALHFVGLQRWNSETPAQGHSVGGGYFVYRTDKDGLVSLGIAIDPGFDFVRNLFHMGFSLNDIDIVLISHTHPDHIWDFESIVQLMNESDGKGGQAHRINAILSLGSYKRVQHVISSPVLKRFINPLVIDIRKELDDNFIDSASFAFQRSKDEPSRWLPILPGLRAVNNGEIITITSTRAYHDDYSEESDSFGFKIEFSGIPSTSGVGGSFSLGYTGDTRWVGDDLYSRNCPISESCATGEMGCPDTIITRYIGCDVLLVHLGSLIDHKSKDQDKRRFGYYQSGDICESLIRRKNHPYLMGVIRLLRSLLEAGQQPAATPRLILLGEFGEELRGGIRKDLIRRLSDCFVRAWPVLPVDVGLDVQLFARSQDNAGKMTNDRVFKFACAVCDKHLGLDKIRYRTFGQDEALFYLCETCDKATSEDVRQNRLTQLYEIGRELVP